MYGLTANLWPTYTQNCSKLGVLFTDRWHFFFTPGGILLIDLYGRWKRNRYSIEFFSFFLCPTSRQINLVVWKSTDVFCKGGRGRGNSFREHTRWISFGMSRGKNLYGVKHHVKHLSVKHMLSFKIRDLFYRGRGWEANLSSLCILIWRIGCLWLSQNASTAGKYILIILLFFALWFENVQTEF